METKAKQNPGGVSTRRPRFHAPRLVLCCVVASAVCGIWAEEPGEILHVPFELQWGSKPVPPCAPLRIVPESARGKKIMVEGVGSRWGRFEIKAKSVESVRFSELFDCVSASERYNNRYPPETLESFNGTEISFGMPIEFAVMALGPPDRVKWDSWEKKSVYRWGSAESDLLYVTVPALSVERLLTAASVVIEEIDPDDVDKLKRSISAVIEGRDLGEPVVTAGIGIIQIGETSAAVEQLVEEQRVAAESLSDVSELRVLYDQGLRLYEQGDHAGALSMWLTLANDGYAVAQYSLGDLYYRGEGVERDLEQAVHWFREAAQGHYPFSQYQLGYLYATGEGVPRDLVEAHRWMQAAETLGHPDAETARKRLGKSMPPEELKAARRLFEENNVVENPVLLRHVDPDYPELARVARVDGSVILQAIVDLDGSVKDIEVIRVNRPNLGFEDAAIEALQHWRYKPAMRGGRPVRVYFTVVVDFSLLDRAPRPPREPQRHGERRPR